MTNLPARVEDTIKNPFVAITVIGISLIFAIVKIARHHHS